MPPTLNVPTQQKKKLHAKLPPFSGILKGNRTINRDQLFFLQVWQLNYLNKHFENFL